MPEAASPPAPARRHGSAGAPKDRENLLLGIVLATMSFACLAAMSAFAKAASPGSPAEVNVFFQNAIAFVVLALVIVGGIVAMKRGGKADKGEGGWMAGQYR